MNKFLVLTAMLSFSLTAYAKDGEACELTKGHKLPKGINFSPQKMMMLHNIVISMTALLLSTLSKNKMATQRLTNMALQIKTVISLSSHSMNHLAIFIMDWQQ